MPGHHAPGEVVAWAFKISGVRLKLAGWVAEQLRLLPTMESLRLVGYPKLLVGAFRDQPTRAGGQTVTHEVLAVQGMRMRVWFPWIIVI
jgi:hypothetical protein